MSTAVAHRVAALAAGRYVSGPDVSDALRIHERVTSSGFATTLAYWNPIREPPARVAAVVEETVCSVTGTEPEFSLKLPALGFDVERVDRIAALAAQRSVALHTDSHEHENVARRLRLLDALGATGSAIGTTLPGRWARSMDDARALHESAACVRVVKGQWPDPGQPGRDGRAGFAEVVECLAGRSGRVAIATHDAPLAYESLLRLQEAGTPCELQLLYGLPDGPALAVARDLGVPVRIYIPFGCGYLPYTLRQARTNPRIAGWLGRDLLLRATGRGNEQRPHAQRAHQETVDRRFAEDAPYWADIYRRRDVQSTIYRRRATVALSWVDELGLPTGARVLEVGCGTGHTAVRLAERGLRVTATDALPEMVERTRAAGNGHALDVRLADVHALPFPPRSFDVVLGLGVLPWLHSPATALAEIARVLVRGGHVVLTADNAARLVDVLDPMFNPRLAAVRHEVGKRVRPRSGAAAARSVQHRPEAVDRMLAAAGFSIARSATVGFGPFTFMRHELLPRRRGLTLDRALQRAADRGNARLARRGRHYMIMATRDGDE